MEYLTVNRETYFVLSPPIQGFSRAKTYATLKYPPPKCSRTVQPPSSLVPALRLDTLVVSPPVILAPMAGVTNYPFRKLCRTYGAALYVSEMVLATSVLSGHSDGRLRFGPDETLRSAQLYATDPSVAGAAAEILIERDGVKHIDLNFGCPAPKVLRRGGGAAIPANEILLRNMASAVVEVARPRRVPVTAKMRTGLSESQLTYAHAGQVLQDCGVAAVTLHARTAKQMYNTGGGRRGWKYIRELRELLDIPVVGNGDVFTAQDALDLVRETGAAGVAIGRGCLGRPWLFRDLREAFRTGRGSMISVPGFEEVRQTMMKHIEEAVQWMALDGVEETAAVKSMRKWFAWYWRGYEGLPDDWVGQMCKVDTIALLREVVQSVDGDSVGYALEEIVKERGKVGRAT